jgi:hypothetical protein
MANAPLPGRDDQLKATDLPDRKSEILYCKGLDTILLICPMANHLRRKQNSLFCAEEPGQDTDRTTGISPDRGLVMNASAV